METFILWVVVLGLVALVSFVAGGVAAISGIEKKMKNGLVPSLDDNKKLMWKKQGEYVDMRALLDELTERFGKS